MTMLRIVPGDFECPQVQSLLRHHLATMHANSPPGTSFALDLSGLARPDIRFYTATESDAVVGMGAIKTLSPTQGELKSMRTHPDHLRKGVGRAMLTHLVNVARADGFERVSLETGSTEEFAAALALYAKFGFRRGEAFGEYPPSSFNHFYHLDLTETS